MDDDLEIYVCITHGCVIPCETGDHHLVSNHPSDIKKIMESM